MFPSRWLPFIADEQKIDPVVVQRPGRDRLGAAKVAVACHARIHCRAHDLIAHLFAPAPFRARRVLIWDIAQRGKVHRGRLVCR
jgi:hypothetical protein